MVQVEKLCLMSSSCRIQVALNQMLIKKVLIHTHISIIYHYFKPLQSSFSQNIVEIPTQQVVCTYTFLSAIDDSYNWMCTKQLWAIEIFISRQMKCN